MPRCPLRLGSGLFLALALLCLQLALRLRTLDVRNGSLDDAGALGLALSE